MKALKILSLVLGLSGCIYAGEVSMAPWRDNFITGFSGYPVEYLDNKKEELLGTETLHESSFKAEKLLTAFKGYSIADTKSYSKNYYVQESLIAPGDAIMTSGVTPAVIESGKKYDVIARTFIKDKLYYLINSDASNHVFLVDENYVLQNRIGTLKSDRLIVMDEQFHINPQEYTFEPITKSRILQSDMVTGFEIKFEGVKNGVMYFTLMEYDRGGSTGEFVTYRFDNEPGVIEIAGVKIKVFSANDEKLEYMIVAE